MRTIILITLFIVTYGCKSTSDLTIVPAGKVVEAHKASNYEFAKRQFEACKTGNFIPLTNAVATPKLTAALTVEVMKQTCAEINQSHGELTKLTLYEVLKRGQSLLIYRYKAQYSNTEQHAEIRVYTDLENKYKGVVFRKIWTNKYYIANPDKE